MNEPGQRGAGSCVVADQLTFQTARQTLVTRTGEERFFWLRSPAPSKPSGSPRGIPKAAVRLRGSRSVVWNGTRVPTNTGVPLMMSGSLYTTGFSRVDICREGRGCRGAENGRYANRETALMFPIVSRSSDRTAPPRVRGHRSPSISTTDRATSASQVPHRHSADKRLTIGSGWGWIRVGMNGRKH